MHEQEKPVNFVLLTVSSTRQLKNDTSGDKLQTHIEQSKHKVLERALVSDDIQAIRQQLELWLQNEKVDVMVTIGGTGLTFDDVTIQAVEPLLDKKIDGFSVLFHQLSMTTVGVSTMNSRALAGVMSSGAGLGKYLFALPGSRGAVTDAWKIIEKSVDINAKPCSLMSVQDRLKPKQNHD